MKCPKRLKKCFSFCPAWKPGLKVLSTFFGGAWTELPSNRSVLKKIPTFLFCGLRYFTPEDELHQDTVWRARDQSVRQQDLWTSWPTLSMAGAMVWMLYFWRVENQTFGHCVVEKHLSRQSEWEAQEVARWMMFSFVIWCIGQVLFRYAVDARTAEDGVVEHGLRALTTLGNFSWMVMLLSMYCVEATLASTSAPFTGISVVHLLFELFWWTSVFFLVAPFMSYMVAIKDNKLSETAFYLILIVMLIAVTRQVLGDVNCGREDMELLYKNFTTGFNLAERSRIPTAISFFAALRFAHVHALALIISITLTDGRWGGGGIVEPDVFMIGELFTPIRLKSKMWLFCLALVSLAVGTVVLTDAIGDSLLSPSPWAQALQNCRFGHTQVSLLSHVVMDFIILVAVVWSYWSQPKRRSVASYHSEVLVLTGLMGTLYFAYAADVVTAQAQFLEVSTWGGRFDTFVLVLDFAAYLAFIILSADTFSGRLVFPGLGKNNICFFVFSCWVTADWALVAASSLLDEHWRDCQTMLPRDPNQESWMHLGQLGMAETGLFLLLGWSVHIVQQLVGHLGIGKEEDERRRRNMHSNRTTASTFAALRTGRSTMMAKDSDEDEASRLGGWALHIKKSASVPVGPADTMRGLPSTRTPAATRSHATWRPVQDIFGHFGGDRSSMLAKPGVAEGLFRMCTHGDCGSEKRMGEPEMRRFAVLCGFTGTREDWGKEFVSLCRRHYWKPSTGPSFKEFREFLRVPEDNRYEISPYLVDLFVKAQEQSVEPSSKKRNSKVPTLSVNKTRSCPSPQGQQGSPQREYIF